MKKHTVVLSAALASLALTFGVIGATRYSSRNHAPIVASKDYEKANAAQDTRPLKERAKEARRLTELQYPHRDLASSDLADLARRSTAIIIGTPVENVTRPTADGRSITLDYQLKIEYVYKGALKQGQTINVSLPGGKLMFDDGSTAEVQTPWFKKMLDGKTYALFLTAGDKAGYFTTTGEAQGVFEIPTDGSSQTVNIHTGIMGDSMLKYQHM
ncbi:MAG: hypothetical protein M3444_08885, partial [Acidobacteriota bacterium]|nr:hypothetical protein [Acidobacteriota bacterium]